MKTVREAPRQEPPDQQAVKRVIGLIVTEFEGDTVAYFNAVRPKNLHQEALVKAPNTRAGR